MTTRPKQLTAPFQAYDYRDIPPDDAELTRVTPGTPGGEYLRRFWQPVALSKDLNDLPKRVRILGEDLVLFRDKAGRTGLLQLYCSHRGASLEFGLVAEQGLRCCYHGWLFDVDGRILETPSEPAGSTLRNRLFHGAYPTREYKGLVFAYLGAPGAAPAFPVYDTFDRPGYTTIPASWVWPANWMQIRENAMDPVHTSFLHTIISGAQFTEEFAVIPETEFQETPIGMIYLASRRVKDMVWTRIAELIMPNIHQFPSNWNEASRERRIKQPMMTNWSVPIDNTSTLIIGVFHQGEGVDLQRMLEDLPGQIRQRTYEEQQRQPGDYEAQVLQRSIAVHALEHLGTSDRGVVMYRRLVKDGIEVVRNGGTPKGWLKEPGGPIPTYTQDTFQRIAAAHPADADNELMRRTSRDVAAGRYLIEVSS
jgi:phenylpropionate dioxygenase-like ring-hydroxylating dioxygenase large terminal subunit